MAFQGLDIFLRNCQQRSNTFIGHFFFFIMVFWPKYGFGRLPGQIEGNHKIWISDNQCIICNTKDVLILKNYSLFLYFYLLNLAIVGLWSFLFIQHENVRCRALETLLGCLWMTYLRNLHDTWQTAPPLNSVCRDFLLESLQSLFWVLDRMLDGMTC